MTYRDTLLQLGEDSAAQVVAVVAAYKAGKIDQDEAVALIAAFVAAANSKATALADLGLAATLSVAVGRAVPTLGLVPPAGDPERLSRAARTLLDVLPDTEARDARAARLGRSEPLTRAAEARGEAIEKSEQVEGWTRSVSGSGCQLCSWWSRNGRVWPKDHRMPTHKGCTCSQTPVITERKP